MFDRNEMKAVIALKGDRQEDLADALGIPPSALSARIKGKIEFRRNEIETIILRYKLTPQDIQRIFFAKTVSQNSTSDT